MTAQTDRLNTALAGRYRIERHLGEGGMAAVYLCEDIKHKRRVALKLLKPELAAVLGADRFVQEITTTAGLQHPHILPLFDSGTADGFLFYVMPYIEGETLRDKLNRETQLGVDEAVRIAREVADALDYAHRHGVIHRDIKPENILMHDGRPMVADFGIALAVSAAAGGRMTETGLSLGTPHYMSPEQATAEKEITARSDIYSLGSVLYEMLTGSPPHTGATAQQIIMKIITEPAESVTKLRKTVPPNVAAAVAKSIEKLPADRFESAKAFADALANPGFTTVGSATTGRRAVGAGGTVSRTSFFAATAVALIATTAAVWLAVRKPEAAERPAVRFTLALAPDERVNDDVGSPYAVSPDGRTIAYAAARGAGATKLYLRQIGDLEARELSGTDGVNQPTFSPDGKTIAFLVGNQVKKVPVSGGTPTILATLITRGIAWTLSGDLVVGSINGGLNVIPAGGGAPRPLTKVDPATGAQGHRWPLMLADGKTLIFANYRSDGLNRGQLGVANLSDGTSRLSSVTGTFPLALIDGQLLFMSSEGAIMATPWDARRHELGPSVVQVADPVGFDPVSSSARAALSRNGTFVYQKGSAKSELVIADIRGTGQPLIPGVRAYGFPRFSPDGKKVAFTERTGTGSDIWTYDLSQKTLAKITNTTAVANDRPEWTPDGKRVLFRSTREGIGLWWMPVDQSAALSKLHVPPGNQVLEGVLSPDGRWLVYRGTGGVGGQDLWYRSLAGDTTPKPFIVDAWYKAAPRFSPDGRWIAYTSDEPGSRQVYVTAFPGPGPHYQLSTSGGEGPVWSPDGKRLYYSQGRQMIAATVSLDRGFSVVGREMLFEGNIERSFVHANYDISPDGKKFLLLRPVDGVGVQTMVVYDWRSELKAKTAGRAGK